MSRLPWRSQEFLRFPQFVVSLRPIGVDLKKLAGSLIIGPYSDCLPELLDRFLEISLFAQEDAQVVVSFSHPGIQPDRCLKFSLSLGDNATAIQSHTETVMGNSRSRTPIYLFSKCLNDRRLT